MTRRTNASPGALTLRQAFALEKERTATAARRQARELAAQGRGEDTEVAHVALGELVIPRALQSPEVLDALQRAAAAHNIPLEMLSVGSFMNSVNPKTGAPEFGIMEWANKLRQRGLNLITEAQSGVAEPFEKDKPVAIVLPSSTAPMAPPSDRDLDYDPKGPGLLGVVKDDPVGAVSALWHAGRSRQEARDRYEGGPDAASLHNGEGDAWRHARWNQRMANAIGPERAKAFADWNERRYGAQNPIGERTMDLVNNREGRYLTGDNSARVIDEFVRSGHLRFRPY